MTSSCGYWVGVLICVCPALWQYSLLLSPRDSGPEEGLREGLQSSQWGNNTVSALDEAVRMI